MSKHRPALSKKARFAILKRDSFTCQYCGAVAPAVSLVVDHVKPLADGGTNDPANLITACFACNSGKSDRLLSEEESDEEPMDPEIEALLGLKPAPDSLAGLAALLAAPGPSGVA